MKRNWYKFRVKYSKVMDDGKKKKVSEEYLVDAESFTETEKRANKAATDLIGTRDFDITAISREAVSDIIKGTDTWMTVRLIGKSSQSQRRKCLVFWSISNSIKGINQKYIQYDRKESAGEECRRKTGGTSRKCLRQSTGEWWRVVEQGRRMVACG